jgi:uncharacterized membrane protein
MSADTLALIALQVMALVLLARAVGRGKSPGVASQAGPFLILAAVAIHILGRWRFLPERLPIHFRWDGQPDRWTPKDPLVVFGFWGVGVTVCLLQLGLGALGRRIKPDASAGIPAGQLVVLQRRMSVVFLGVEYLIATVFSISLLTIVNVRPFPVMGAAVATAAFFVWLGYVVLRLSRDLQQVVEAEVPSAQQAWRGIFYVNPEDPRLWVPKRFGMGYTLNFARPVAWLILLALLVLPVLAVLATARR